MSMPRIVRSALRDLFPGGPLPSAEDTDLDAFWARFWAEASPSLRAGVLAGALIYTATPILTVKLPLPAFALPASLRDRHAARITEHDRYLLRQAVFVLKLIGGLAWGADPHVREAFGLEPYPPDPGTWRER